MAKKKRPSKKLLADIQNAFSKHGVENAKVATLIQNLEAGVCPPGQTPHNITYQLPDGTWVTKTVCL